MFLNPVMLAGLGGAAVPLVLHLLARSRYRNIEWGAMMFLDGLDASHAHSTRMKQWLLLGMRMALVALLAMAMARPVVQGQWTDVGSQSRVTAVIMLDRSYSMALEEAGRSRFDKAREAALQVLAGLRKGDEAALVLLGDQIDSREPTSNLQMVARDMAELQVSGGSADIAAGLEAAKQILNQPGRANRELYLICDRQAVSWQNLGVSTDARWLWDRQAPTRFYVIPVGGEETDNVAVESVELVDSVVVRGQQAEVEVRVHNYAATPRVGLELTLSVIRPGDVPRRLSDTGMRLKTVPVAVGAHATATARVPVVFDQIGSHVLIAQIQTCGLPADDRFDKAIDVIDPIEVLLVSGDEAQSEIRRESFFLNLALTPHQTVEKKSQDACVVTIKRAEDWSSASIDKYRVIILANVPQLTADQARMLEQRVYEGGGLIIAPGNLCRLDNYNSVLYREGLGLLPARLERATAADGSEATSLLGLDLDHPIFRFQRGGDPLPDAVIGRYYVARPRDTGVRKLGTYASGDPFLIEGPRGRGRVLLVSTSLDADWGRLPLDPFYLPFVQLMVRYACAPSLSSRNLSVNDTLIATFDQPLEAAELWRNEERLNLPGMSGKMQVLHRLANRAGIYWLVARFRDASGGTQVLHYVAQAPRHESDMSVLTDEQWDRHQRMLGFIRINPAEQSPGAVASSDRAGRELWLLLLTGAILLGVGELWLARRWGRGVA